LKIENATLKIMTTDRCNANCIFCTREWAKNKDMSIEMFTNIIKQLPQVKRVHPQMHGELFVHPDILEMIKILKDNKKSVRFHTNGSLIKGNIAKKLAELEPEDVMFSIDACDKEMYEYFRRGLKWEVVYNNVINFQSIKTSKTKTTVKCLITAENRNKKKQIKQFWKDKVDHFKFIYEAPKIRNVGKEKRYDQKCHQIEKIIAIDVDGSIKLCCEDWFSTTIVGHVNDGIIEVLNSDKVKKLKDQIRNKQFLPMCEKCIILYDKR